MNEMGGLNQRNSDKKLSDIICMSFSIRVFRLYGFFPPANEMLNPGQKFYIKFVLIALYCSLVLVGSTLHLVKSIKDNSYNHAELDITYIISMCAGYALICSFITKVKSAVQLWIFLSDFSEFEKPNDFEETNKKFNRYAKYHYCYLESIVIFILLGSNIFKGAQCREENRRNDSHEVCGLFTYTWMPFDIDFFPVKQIYLFEQLFGAHYVYILAGTAAWVVLESIEHIACRIRHVTYLFNEALRERDAREKRTKFNSAVRYHIAVLKLQDAFNKSFSLFMFTHMVMAGAIMGYGVYAFMKSESIGTELYYADWTDCDTELKKDILFVLMRCRQQMVLKAASFGVMDHPMFLAVIVMFLTGAASDTFPHVNAVDLNVANAVDSNDAEQNPRQQSSAGKNTFRMINKRYSLYRGTKLMNSFNRLFLQMKTSNKFYSPTTNM